MNKKIQLLIVFVLVAGMFVTSTGSVSASALSSLQADPVPFSKYIDPYPVDFQPAKPPPAPVLPPPQAESMYKEPPPGPRCEFSQPYNDLLPDLGTCELDTNTLIDFGLPFTVRSVAAIYQGDLPFPMNGMPLLAPPTGVEYFPEGSTGNLSVCFEVPEGKSGNISFWDMSSVPNVETELPTFVRNGVACTVGTRTGVYGLVENLPF